MKRKQTSLALLAVLLCTVLIATPTVCSAIYFVSSVSRQLSDMARSSADFYLEQFSESAKTTMDSIRNCILLLTTNDSVRQMMVSGEPVAALDKQEIEEQIGQTLLHSSAWNSSGLRGVYIYKNDGTYFTMLRDGIYSGATQRIAQVYARTSSHNSARSLITFEDIPGYAYCVTDYTDLTTMSSCGKMIFEIRFSLLVGASYINTLYPGAAVFLSGADGDLYFSSRADTEGQSAFLPLLSENNALPNNHTEVDDVSYYHAQRSLPGYDMKVDAFLPKSEIFSTVNQTMRFYLVYSIVVLLITLLLGALAYLLLTGPLRRMVAKIYHMAEGDLSVRMDSTPYRETEQIVTAFNQMGDELEGLFGEVYEQGLLLREAEFDLLESQISPHFIFNVLESINMRSAQAGQEDVCSMVTNLAELLRSNILHKGHQKVSFRQELAYVSYYLELQKMRFEDKLQYSIDLEDDDVLECFLPKLTIQPLVENAVVHGIENKREGGCVSVRIWEDDCIYIRVQDDGIGFDVSQPPAGENGHNHIALDNIRRRIALLYGAVYGVTITSTMGVGTIVTVTVPRDGKGEFPC